MAMSLPRIDANLLVRHLQDVVAVEQDFAGDDLARRTRDEAHDRKAGHALAAAGLAHDAERLARHDVKGNIIDRFDDAVLSMELRFEVPHFEYGTSAAIAGGFDRCRALGPTLRDHARSSHGPR